MNQRTVWLGLLVWLAVCVNGLGGDKPGPGNIQVSFTSRFIFAFDENGNVLWKNPFPWRDVVNYAQGSGVVAVNTGRVLRVLDLLTGRELWRTETEHRIEGVAVSGDTVLVATGSDLVSYRARSGHLVRRRKREHTSRKAWVANILHKLVPRQPVRTKVVVEVTPRVVVAFDQDARTLWKMPRGFYRFLGTSFRLGFLASRDSVRVFDTRTGRVLWRKGYPSPIDHVVIGSRTEVILAKGDVYVHKSDTGELLKKERR